MIGQLTGLATPLGEKTILIDVAGVGYLVQVLPELAALAKGQTLTVWTHLAVKEDALDLYGFENREELQFFELLVSVPGIGPKSALGILNLAPPTTLRQAIASGKTEYLTRVSGIGRKSAEKIVLELRDKLGKIATNDAVLEAEADAVEALKALGYSLREARESLRDLPEEVKDVGEQIKLALQRLNNRNR
jgi:Holliday junction DNA helicase RuvA